MTPLRPIAGGTGCTDDGDRRAALRRIQDAVIRQDRVFSARLDDTERATLIALLTRLYRPDSETPTARAGIEPNLEEHPSPDPQRASP